MTAPLECFVTTASGQQVRVRLLGAGPAVVLCHESPRSGAALLPLAKHLANTFTCVILDTPGFGLSEPLKLTRPEIPDYAAIVLDVTAQFGLDKASYYGTHTGAAIAIEAAVQAPDRVAGVVLDGYALFSPTERDELLAAYLTPIHPGLDGTHVAWLWSRVRDQFTAFPWHRVGDAGRLPFGPPPIETLQAVVDDFLLAGDHYRAAYAAAFRYDHLKPVQLCEVPVQLAARTDDLLFPHLQNAVGVPNNVIVGSLPADRVEWAKQIGRWLQSYALEQDAVDAATLLSRIDHKGSQYHIVNTSVSPVLLRFDGPSTGEPLLLLHDVPGDLTTLDSLAEHLARTHRVVRLDLPGLGASRLGEGMEPTVESLATGVREALADIAVGQFSIVAVGASAAVALELLDAEVQSTIIVDPWTQQCDAGAELPDLVPRWDGGHLMSSFYWAREYELYKPWYNRTNADSRSLGGERDVQMLHQRYRASVIAGNTGVQAAAALYRYDCKSLLTKAAIHASVLLYEDDPDVKQLQRWANECLSGDAIYRVSKDPRSLAAAIAELLPATVIP
ncbi:MAG: pimeloyl-ACP methyl ester carboxylesterase [Granulosicoccus sp.]|jgi:pimeloyl-ACP methyl ester carboxylesterase